MPKSRIKRGRKERTIEAVTRPPKQRVRCPACGAEQELRTACVACHAALTRDGVIDANGTELDVATIASLPYDVARARLLTHGGVPEEHVDEVLGHARQLHELEAKRAELAAELAMSQPSAQTAEDEGAFGRPAADQTGSRLPAASEPEG